MAITGSAALSASLSTGKNQCLQRSTNHISFRTCCYDKKKTKPKRLFSSANTSFKGHSQTRARLETWSPQLTGPFWLLAKRSHDISLEESHSRYYAVRRLDSEKCFETTNGRPDPHVCPGSSLLLPGTILLTSQSFLPKTLQVIFMFISLSRGLNNPGFKWRMGLQTRHKKAPSSQWKVLGSTG